MQNKALIIKNRAMGDAILGLASLHYLSEQLPDFLFDYAIPAWICPLLQKQVTKNIRVIPLDMKIHGSREFLGQKYDFIYELHQSGSSAKYFKLMGKLTSTPYYFHNHHKLTGPVRDQGAKKASIQRDLDGCWSALRRMGINSKIPHYLSFEPSISTRANLEGDIVFGIVATRGTKKWPVEYFSKLSQLINEKFPNKKIFIPISSSDEDQELALYMSKFDLSSNCVFIKSSLEELPLKIKSASIYFGNDTGIKHLAIAMGMKSLTVFGPEQPTEWHPYNPENHPYFLYEPLDCRTAENHYCGLTYCSTMYCQKYIKPDEVFKKFLELAS